MRRSGRTFRRFNLTVPCGFLISLKVCIFCAILLTKWAIMISKYYQKEIVPTMDLLKQ